MKNKKFNRSILQVIPSATYSCIEKSAIAISKESVSQHFDTIVVSDVNDIKDESERLGAKYVRLNISSTNFFTIILNAFRIASIIRKYNVKVVHARSRAPAWSSYLASKMTCVHFITTCHAIYDNTSIFKKYYNSIISKGETIIAVSEYIREYLIENYNVTSSRIKVINRGVNCKYYDKNVIENSAKENILAKYHITKKNPVILLPAQFSRWKGHFNLIEAVNKIRDLDFLCLLVGDLSKHTDYVSEIKAKIFEYKLQSKIQIYGLERDMRSLYAISDIVLLTSSKPEAYLRNLAEAQSMEKLVIAPNHGASGEIIDDGVTGFLYNQEDLEDLPSKIKISLDMINHDKHGKITKLARKNIKDNYSVENMVKSTLDIYLNVVK